MTVEILDEATAPGYAVNEDAMGHARFGAVVTAWVLDGATGVAGRNYVPEGPSDAAWVAGRLSAHLAALDPAAASPQAYIAEVLERVAAEYRAAVPGWRDLPPYALPSAAGVWVRMRDGALDIAWLGDCVGVVRQSGETLRLVGVSQAAPWEDNINQVVAERQAQDAGDDRPMLQVLGAELQARRVRLNQPGGYWMLGVEPRAAEGLRSERIVLEGETAVLLLSDGLWRLVDHFHRYDAAGLVAAALDRGLGALIEEVRQLERADPQGRAVPRVKPYDDATAILLQITA
jgi:hypothetical protein